MERSREGGGRSKSLNTSWSEVLDAGRGIPPCSEILEEGRGNTSWSEAVDEIRGNTSWSETLDEVRWNTLWSELTDELRGVADLGGTGGGGGEPLTRACSARGTAVLLFCS